MPAIHTDVPLPSQVAENKFYLPAFDLVVTMASQKAAEALECGLLSLIQYRGAPACDFNVAMGFPREDFAADPFAHGIECLCPVAMATRLQLFTSGAVGVPERHPQQLLALIDEFEQKGKPLEAWEVAYIQATAPFLRHDFEASTERSLVALQKTPHDAFSARLLLIAAYFGEDLMALRDGFGAITVDYETAIAKQVEAVAQGAAPKHALHLALPSLMAWAAFGLEETRQSLPQAEVLSKKAIAQTEANNKKYFPSGKPGDDMPERAGALAAVADDAGFTCVFAVHTILHCYETHGDPAGGLAYIRNTDPKMWQPAIHLAGHLWWHVGLFELESGDAPAALQTFQKYLGDPDTSDLFSLADSAALLLRVWFWAMYFRTAPASGNATWNRDTITADLERATAEGLLMLNDRFDKHDDDTLFPFPFFDVHKQLVRAAAAWVESSSVGAEGEKNARFREWPVKAPIPARPPTDPNVVLIHDGRERRDTLVRCLRSGTTHILAASALKGPSAKEFASGISDWLSAINRLAAVKPMSAYNRTVVAGGPMGGSIAQQSLISFTLLLLWALSETQEDAALALKCMTAAYPKHPLYLAAVDASGVRGKP